MDPNHRRREHRGGVKGDDSAFSEFKWEVERFKSESDGFKWESEAFTSTVNEVDDSSKNPQLGVAPKSPTPQSAVPAAAALFHVLAAVRRSLRQALQFDNQTNKTTSVFLCGVAAGTLLTLTTRSVPESSVESSAGTEVIAGGGSLFPDDRVTIPVALASQPARETASGTAMPAKKPAPSLRGVLIVRSNPAGARVTLNGQPAGITPLVLTNLKVGSRAVRLTRDGYAPWTSVVRIVTGQKVTVTADLQGTPPPQ